MDMVPVSDFYPELRRLVSGVMNEIMAEEVVRAARKFCSDTNVIILTEKIAPTTENQTFIISDLWTASGQSAEGTEFSNIVRISGDGSKLYEGIDYNEPSRGTVTINEKYDEVEIIASIQPVNRATSLPKILYEDYATAICHGAASELFVQIETVNGDMHNYHDQEYYERMRKAKRWRLDSLPHQPSSPTRRNRSFF